MSILIDGSTRVLVQGLTGNQGSFHASPDYTYWYGWAQMTKDLGEIQELAATMRATHGARSRCATPTTCGPG